MARRPPGWKQQQEMIARGRRQDAEDKMKAEQLRLVSDLIGLGLHGHPGSEHRPADRRGRGNARGGPR